MRLSPSFPGFQLFCLFSFQGFTAWNHMKVELRKASDPIGWTSPIPKGGGAFGGGALVPPRQMGLGDPFTLRNPQMMESHSVRDCRVNSHRFWEPMISGLENDLDMVCPHLISLPEGICFSWLAESVEQFASTCLNWLKFRWFWHALVPPGSKRYWRVETCWIHQAAVIEYWKQMQVA